MACQVLRIEKSKLEAEAKNNDHHPQIMEDDTHSENERQKVTWTNQVQGKPFSRIKISGIWVILVQEQSKTYIHTTKTKRKRILYIYIYIYGNEMVAMTSTRLWILNERNKLYVERKREILCWSSKSSWDSWEREGRSGRGSGRESGALKVSLYQQYIVNIILIY